MTRVEKRERKKKHVSIQTNAHDSLMHTGSFAGSSLAMFSLFCYYQAYGRGDYRHWGPEGGQGWGVVGGGVPGLAAARK